METAEWVPVFKKSTRKDKKYMVRTPSGKVVHFGASKYDHYEDSTGMGEWSDKDHKDPD